MYFGHICCSAPPGGPKYQPFLVIISGRVSMSFKAKTNYHLTTRSFWSSWYLTVDTVHASKKHRDENPAPCSPSKVVYLVAVFILEYLTRNSQNTGNEASVIRCLQCTPAFDNTFCLECNLLITTRYSTTSKRT